MLEMAALTCRQPTSLTSSSCSSSWLTSSSRLTSFSLLLAVWLVCFCSPQPAFAKPVPIALDQASWVQELGSSIGVFELPCYDDSNTTSCNWNAIICCNNKTGDVTLLQVKDPLQTPNLLISDGVTALTGLTYLMIASQYLVGAVPDGIWTALKELRHLAVGVEASLGSFNLPPSFSLVTKLTKLEVSKIAASGSIASDISKITGLRQLVLSNLNITGSLPSSIGELTQLTKLVITASTANNQIGLTGPIPPNFGNLTNLVTLDLSKNDGLKSSIPSSFSALQSLSDSLDLSYNSISGTLPDSLSLLSRLKRLDVSNNIIGGFVPDILSAMTSLQFLNLCANNFFGTLPAAIGTLPNLTYIGVDFSTSFGCPSSYDGACPQGLNLRSPFCGKDLCADYCLSCGKTAPSPPPLSPSPPPSPPTPPAPPTPPPPPPPPSPKAASENAPTTLVLLSTLLLLLAFSLS